MTKTRATEAALDELHGEVARVLTAGVQAEGASPQMLAQAIKFLQMNGIDAPAKSQRMRGLADALADLDADEVAAERHMHS